MKLVWIISFLIHISFFGFCFSARHGHRAETLFAHSVRDQDVPLLVTRENTNSAFSQVIEENEIRTKRSLSSDKKSNLDYFSVFHLNYSHEQLLVHWAGKGSNITICLARDRKQSKNSTSLVFFSEDNGKTFREIQVENMKIGPEMPSIISMFYISPVLNNHYIFTDVVNNYIFTTRDFGKTFDGFDLPFKPDIVSLHPADSEIILAMEDGDPAKKLWYSEDFGVTWKDIQQEVKAFFWGVNGVDPDDTLFVERLEPNNSSTVLSSVNYFSSRPTVVSTNVLDFEVRDKFLFITRRQHLLGSKLNADILQLWVSYDRKPFKMAELPSHLERKEIFIVDASDDQALICVMHGTATTNLYVSGPQGMKFSLSLENIVYVSGTLSTSLENSIRGESFADIHKVKGLRGVYIATKLKEGTMLHNSFDNIVSVITFDKGGEWQYINPPKADKNGNPIACKISEGCSLHLTQQFSLMFQSYESPPILTKESSIGLIMASGVVGKSLKGHPSVFASSDAGVTWREVLYGSYMYRFGDFGGIIVAAPFYNQQETDEVIYSTDDGATWQTIKFTDKEPIRIFGLMTEPGEKRPIFTLFGSKKSHHEWLLVTLDLRHVFKRECIPTDYKEWTPHVPNRPCLLGQKEVYQRRIADTSCFIGENYQRLVQTENCPCEREDFECDFGFKEEMSSGNCIWDEESEGKSDDVPSSCVPGGTYNRTRGYRKVPGDSCIGGDDTKFLPGPELCPIEGNAEFLLVSELHKISRFNLNSEDKKLMPLPLPDVHNVIALDYHYKNHCIYWEDTDEKKILRHCFSIGGRQEVIVESNVASVEGLALDWLSDNLYFSDRERSCIEVVRIDVPTFQLRRSILNKTHIDKPRGIAVHPAAGYLFLTDWSDTRPSVSRSYLDGSHFQVLIDSSKVTWPNGVTVDLKDNRIFWTDAKLDYIASADLDGGHMKYIIQGPNLIPHPFAVAVYKDWLYFDDWTHQLILMANKHDGSGLFGVASTSTKGMDVKVFANGLQNGTNVCSGPRNGGCSHICIPYPDQSRVCLCPEWALKQKQQDGSEVCKCADKSLMAPNGSCHHTGSCKESEFMCNNGKCIASTKKCDGHNDCDDYSDEGGIFGACASTCSLGQFTCKNGVCINNNFRCDFDDDCGDDSDEQNCDYPKCTSKEFQCKNGRCIKSEFVCDFDDDCKDGSDEVNCTTPEATCQKEEFSCANAKQCLPLLWRCDGDADCHDNSDEEHCDNTTCENFQFQCKNGRCIFESWRCDGQNDCSDHSDEMNCTTTSTSTTTTSPTSSPRSTVAPVDCTAWMFKCATGTCVPFWWRCDGVDDCGDSSDEVMCELTSSMPATTTKPSVKPEGCGENKFACSPVVGDCIWSSFICDGMNDCQNGVDEQNCGVSKACDANSFRCVHSQGCVSNKLVCDGKKDCGDGSDEWGCKPLTNTTAAISCLQSQYMCNSGDCIDLTKWCDQNEDCPDGSDEHLCKGSTAYYKVNNLRVSLESVGLYNFVVEWDPPLNTTQLKFVYLPSYRESTSSEWQNATWTNSTRYDITNLLPRTDYIVTVYVRLENNNKVAPPSEFITIKTAAKVPEAPRNVSIKVFNTKNVWVHWELPEESKADITLCRVYITPPYPPYFESTKDLSPPLKLNFHFEPGIKYTFTVTSFVDDLESPKSFPAVMEFDKSAALDPVTRLQSEHVSENSAHIHWNAVSNQVDGYTVQYRPTYISKEFQVEVNTTATSLSISNLAPGAKYLVKVFSFKGIYKGPDEKVQFTTQGILLPMISKLLTESDKNNISLKWNPPNDNRTKDWTYGVFVLSQNFQNGFELKANTKKTKYILTNLLPCTIYVVEVRVIGPYGMGPANNVHYTATDFDRLAPPRNLSAAIVDDDVMVLSWQPSCSPLPEHITYIVRVKNEVLHTVDWINLTPEAGEYKLQCNYTVHYGSNYTVQVRSNVPNSTFSAPVNFVAPPLPGVTQFRAFREDNGTFYMDWKEVTWPPHLKDHKFFYRICVSKNSDMSSAQFFNVTKPPFMFEKYPIIVGVVHVGINVLEEHGYQGPMSAVYDLTRGESAAAVVLTTSSLVSITTSIVVIILLLVAAVMFFAIRHRRLQRSFMSFANSHYDTRSGEATFTTAEGLDEEEESPMIRGFSDDEPLVIA